MNPSSPALTSAPSDPPTSGAANVPAVSVMNPLSRRWCRARRDLAEQLAFRWRQQ
ncbi:MAG TPA: hypothetical protein VGN81_22635 [Pseudonocardiaceae bacterium]